MKRFLPPLLLTLALVCAKHCQADLVATFNAASDVPVAANGYTASGTASFALNFAPAVGTNLMVVNNTGLAFINGTFSNLARGQVVTLGYGGVNYRFIANYYGGTGNDLVLQWAKTRPVAWGNDLSGRLGDSGFTDQHVPVNVVTTGVLAGKTVLAMSAGNSHTLALCSDGTVAAWGVNNDGQLGNNSLSGSSVPVAVTTTGVLSGKRVIAIAAGGSHSLALCSDGTLAVWGANGFGQLGNNSTSDSLVPVAVNTSAGSALAGKTVVAIAAGDSHSLALCSDGTVSAWGENGTGKLGTGSWAPSIVPVAVNSTGVLAGKTIVTLAAGYDHSLALCSDGTVVAWGSQGQLGNNASGDSNLPVLVDSTGVLAGKTVTGIAAGGSFSLARCSDGSVAAWGSNGYGDLGNNGINASGVPVAVNAAGVLAGKTVVAMAAGGDHSLALCSDGAMTAWGFNYNGQLGNNSTANSSVPVAVSNSPLANGELYAAIFCGCDADHSLALVASPYVPVAATLAATNVTEISATLNGTVNPNGNATTAQFEYGLDTSYGTTATVTLSPSDGLTAQNVSASLSGLTPGTTYHYRLTASSAAGAVSTTDGTITTAPLLTNLVLSAGTLNPGFASNITSYAATAATASITITPSAAGVSSSTQINGVPVASGTTSGPFALGYGANPITIVAIAQDGVTTKNYTITFTRSPPLPLVAAFGAATDVALTTNGLTAAGSTVSFSLDFAPPVGTNLMVVKNTGVAFINGTFSNLAQGQVVTLSYGGVNYRFIANYYGGTGNDLVLQWAQTRAVAWGNDYSGELADVGQTPRWIPVPVTTSGALAGKTILATAAGNSHSLFLSSDGTLAGCGYNGYGQLGNNSTTSTIAPVVASTTGVLAGKTVVAIAAGNNHSLALCSDGSVAAWGYNVYGQLGNNSTSNSSVPVAVNASTGSALAGKTVVAIAAGNNHSLAICSDGTVAAWGYNSSGQLGNNSTTNSSVPVVVTNTGLLASKTVIAIAGGGTHSLALCSDGTAVGWGANNIGQLGVNSFYSSTVPVAVYTAGVLAGKTVVAIGAGDAHTIALCSDGSAATWGDNEYGQLGIRGVSYSTAPVAVNTAGVLAGKTVIAVAAGYEHNVAVCSDGTMAAWGHNFYGQLGNNNTTDSLLPVAVNGSLLANGESYVTASSSCTASQNFAFIASPPVPVVTTLVTTNVTKTGASLNGTINPNGNATTVQFQYGLTTSYGSTAAVVLSPPDGATAQNVSANLGGLTPGTIYHYRLTATSAAGTISTTDSTFAASLDVAAIYNFASDVPVTAGQFSASGATFSAALNFAPTRGNDLMVVKNTGQTFINGTFSNLAQGQIVTLTYGGVNYRYVANYYGGTGNDLVLQCAWSRPVAWGDGTYGELGDGTSFVNRFVPVNVLANGALTGETVLAMAAGSQHSIATCADGALAAWGYNGSAQLGNGSTTSSITPVNVNSSGVLAGKTVAAVTAGDSHNLAVCSDGTLLAWGANGIGQLGIGSTTSSLVPVAVLQTGVLSGRMVVAAAGGYYHSLALCSDGTVAAWGGNSFGQLGNNRTADSSAPEAVVASSGSALAGKTVVAIAAGQYHSLALCSDGTVASWGAGSELGNNGTTDSSVPVAVVTSGLLAGKTVIAIAGGAQHSLALCSDGTVAAWGTNGYGELGNNTTSASNAPVAVSTSAGSALAGKTVVAISAGAYLSYALCSDGTLAAWGRNASGQLGNNSTTNSSIPVAVNSALVANGERFSAVFSGPLSIHGLGSIASAPFPSVTPLALTNLMSSGVTLNGIVNPRGNATTARFQYGLTNSYGGAADVVLLPNDGMTAQNVSASLSGLTPNTTYHYRLTATNVAGTGSTSDGTFTTPIDVVANYNSASDVSVTAASVAATGGNFSATLNFAPAVGTNLMVVKVTGLGFINGTFNGLPQGQSVTLSYGGVNYTFVANYFGGSGNDLVLQWKSARAAAWGLNSSGQIGDNSFVNRLVPVNVVSTGVLAGKTVVSGSAGQAHSLVLCSDGTLAAWGDNTYGELGSFFGSSLVPAAVSAFGTALSGETVAAVAAGGSHSLAVCSDGTVAAWGANTNGQLGNNFSTGNGSTPVAVNTAGVLAGKTVVAVAAGSLHSLALCSDGTLAAWGGNTNGQLGNNSTTQSGVPVAVSTAGVLAGKTVVAIAAGSSHSLALCSDGTVVGWGANTNGQLGNNSTTQSTVPVAVNTTGVLAGKTVVAVAGGGSHSLALCSNGTLAAWGANASGQLGNNSTTQSTLPTAVSTAGVFSGKVVVALAAGASHSMAVCADGTLAAWGADASGQLGNNSTTQSTIPVAVNGSLLATGESFTVLFSGPTASHNLGIIASPAAPTATSLAATSLSSSGATLSGTVNAAGGSASVFFDYGFNTFYGHTVAGTPTPVAGATNTAVSATLTGLLTNATYHYRVRAVSAASTSNGADLTFVTPNNNANLANLVLSTGTLTPVFSSGTTSYAATMSNSTATVTVAATLADSAAALTINGVPATSGIPSTSINLNLGSNSINTVVTALDGVTTNTYTVVVTRLTALQDWRQTYFHTTANSGNAADTFDYDGNGLPNLMKYAFGLDPTSTSSRQLPPPVFDGNTLTTTFTAPAGVSGVTYGAEWTESLNPANWQPMLDTGSGSTHIFSISVSNHSSLFMRLKVSEP